MNSSSKLKSNFFPINVFVFILGYAFIFMLWSCEDPTEPPVPEATILKDFPVIDVHQHIYSASTFWRTESEAGYDYYTTPVEHYETMVQRMEENNVVLAVSSGSLDAIAHYYENYPEHRHMFQFSAEYWKIAGASLETTQDDLRKAIESGQVRSIGEFCGIYDGVSLDDPTYMALYALADSCSLPVFIHTGIVPSDVYAGFPDYANSESNPVHLKAVLEMYPGTNFNAAHWGSSTRKDYDFMDDVLEMMHTYDNFYVDLGYTLWLNRKSKKASDQFIQRAICESVEHKLLFGSDEMIWPDAITGGINHIKEADYMSDSIKKQILYWNAASYLKLSKEEIAAHFGN